MSIAPWTVLVAAVLPVLTVGMAKFPAQGYDNHQPRDWASGLTGYRRRAYAAHLNHFEFFPFFAAAALLAELRLNGANFVGPMALVIIGARLIYTGAYLADRANLRSVAWAVAWLGTVALFAAAAIGK